MYVIILSDNVVAENVTSQVLSYVVDKRVKVLQMNLWMTPFYCCSTPTQATSRQNIFGTEIGLKNVGVSTL